MSSQQLVCTGWLVRNWPDLLSSTRKLGTTSSKDSRAPIYNFFAKLDSLNIEEL